MSDEFISEYSMATRNDDWAAQQTMDEAVTLQRADDAFKHLEAIVSTIENQFRMEMTETRGHLDFLKSYVYRR